MCVCDKKICNFVPKLSLPLSLYCTDQEVEVGKAWAGNTAKDMLQVTSLVALS